jgi:protein-L-isoaspartate(D-aspartate) O-methyltransferase
VSPVVDYKVARLRMVREQLIDRGITDERVLKAMSIVPRHLFVNQGFWPRAYGNHPLPIGNGQTISQPYIIGAMCQELSLPENGKVLEIGTGSGYQTAILAVMGNQVYTVERHAELADTARAILKKLGISGISFLIGDGSVGWEQESPFDSVVVSAGAPDVPDELVAQVKSGGRVVIPVGDREGQRLMIIEKKDNMVEKRDRGPCMFVPLVGKKGWTGD